MAVGLIAIYGSAQLGLGTLQEPGAGFLSFLSGSFISLFAIIVVFQSLFKKTDEQVRLPALWENLKWWKPVALSILMLAYMLVLTKVGFLITSFLFLLILFKIENLLWRKAVLISLLTSMLCYLLLSVLLKVTIPRGIFGF